MYFFHIVFLSLIDFKMLKLQMRKKKHSLYNNIYSSYVLLKYFKPKLYWMIPNSGNKSRFVLCLRKRLRWLINVHVCISVVNGECVTMIMHESYNSGCEARYKEPLYQSTDSQNGCLEQSFLLDNEYWENSRRLSN